MKYMIELGSVLMVVLLFSSCTSFETNDSLFADQETLEEAIDVLGDELVDIEDDEIALGGFGGITQGFDIGRFTSVADDYTDRLFEDVGVYLNDVEDYALYLEVAKVPKNDLMAAVNIELEYMLQYDDATWTDRRSDYLNGEGYSISSFNRVEDTYIYDLTFNDQSGAYKVVEVHYDSLLERYDYSSESFNEEGVLGYAVRQQFCRDDEGGYYYQAVRQGVLDGFERVSFSHFDDLDYQIYVRPATKTSLADAFAYNLYEKVPESIDQLTNGFDNLQYFSNQKGEFDFELVQ